MVKLSLLASLLKNRVIHFPLRCVISSLRLIDTFLPNSLFSASIISFCASSVHVSLIRKGLIAARLTARFEPCKMQGLWEHIGVFYERWTDGLTVHGNKSPEWSVGVHGCWMDLPSRKNSLFSSRECGGFCHVSLRPTQLLHWAHSLPGWPVSSDRERRTVEVKPF